MWIFSLSGQVGEPGAHGEKGQKGDQGLAGERGPAGITGPPGNRLSNFHTTLTPFGTI